MAMTASQIIDLIAPGYASDPDKASFITLAKMQTSLCFYGDNYQFAVALRAAHMLVLRDRASGDAGPIASKREGDLAVSYGVGSTDGGDLSLTHYGQQLQGLRKGSGAFIGVTGGLDNGCNSECNSE